MRTVVYISNPKTNFPVSQYTDNVIEELSVKGEVTCYHNKINKDDDNKPPAWFAPEASKEDIKEDIVKLLDSSKPDVVEMQYHPNIPHTDIMLDTINEWSAENDSKCVVRFHEVCRVMRPNYDSDKQEKLLKTISKTKSAIFTTPEDRNEAKNIASNSHNKQLVGSYSPISYVPSNNVCSQEDYKNNAMHAAYIIDSIACHKEKKQKKEASQYRSKVNIAIKSLEEELGFVYNRSNYENYLDESQQAGDKIDISNPIPLGILYFGMIKDDKGILDYLKVAPEIEKRKEQLAESGIDLQLVIAGKIHKNQYENEELRLNSAAYDIIRYKEKYPNTIDSVNVSKSGMKLDELANMASYKTSFAFLPFGDPKSLNYGGPSDHSGSIPFAMQCFSLPISFSGQDTAESLSNKISIVNGSKTVQLGAIKPLNENPKHLPDGYKPIKQSPMQNITDLISTQSKVINNITGLVDNPAEYAKYLIKGFEHVTENANWGALANKRTEIYDALIEKGNMSSLEKPSKQVSK